MRDAGNKAFVFPILRNAGYQGKVYITVLKTKFFMERSNRLALVTVKMQRWCKSLSFP